MTTSGDSNLPDSPEPHHKVTNADALAVLIAIIGIAGVVGAFYTKSALALVPTVLALIFFAAK